MCAPSLIKIQSNSGFENNIVEKKHRRHLQALVGPYWEKLCPKSWVWLEVVRSFFLKKKRKKLNKIRAFPEIIYNLRLQTWLNKACCKKLWIMSDLSKVCWKIYKRLVKKRFSLPTFSLRHICYLRSGISFLEREKGKKLRPPCPRLNSGKEGKAYESHW